MKLLRRRTQNTLFAVAAGLVLALFLLIYTETGSPPAFDTESAIVKQPQFYLTNSDSQQYDEQGLLDTSIQSLSIQHHPADDSVGLQQPWITLYQEGVPNWTISAETGLVTQEGEKVDLRDQVLIISSDQLTSLRTQQLFIYPNQKQAQTTQPVLLTSSTGTTSAIGLEADLNTQFIALLDKVRGQYEPEVLPQ